MMRMIHKNSRHNPAGKRHAKNGIWYQWSAPNQAWFIMWGDETILHICNTKAERDDYLKDYSGWKGNPPLRQRHDVDFGKKWQRGHYGPSKTIQFTDTTGREREAVIGAGSEDHVWVFSGYGLIYVLSINYRLPYVGLEAIDDNGEPAGDVFLNKHQTYETLGDNWEDLDPKEIAETLSEYVQASSW